MRNVSPRSIDPPSGSSEPVNRFRNVLFPTPFFPTIPTRSKRENLYEKRSSIVRSANFSVTSSQSIIFPPRRDVATSIATFDRANDTVLCLQHKKRVVFCVVQCALLCKSLPFRNEILLLFHLYHLSQLHEIIIRPDIELFWVANERQYILFDLLNIRSRKSLNKFLFERFGRNILAVKLLATLR